MIGNAAVSWQSKLQHTVALSSCEAEYLSLSAAVKEALHLRYLLSDILSHSVLNQPILLFEDNQSCIKLSQNVEATSTRTKHIDIRHHHVKDHVDKGDIVLAYVPTDEQAAVCLNKSLERVKHQSFRQTILGLRV